MRPVIKKMLEESWDIKKGEKILIISDSPSVEDFISKPLNLIESMLQRNLLARRIYEIMKEFLPDSIDLYFIKPTYQHFRNPDDKVLENKLQNFDIIFSLTEFSLTDVERFEKLLSTKKVRHISAPLVSAEVFLPGGPIDVDYQRMEKISTRLYALVNEAKKIDIFDLAGSHLTLDFSSKAQWLFESGFSNKKGVFSNIPAGEVSLILSYQQEICSINGVLNIFPGWQEDLTSQLNLVIQDCLLVEVRGGGKAGERLKKLIDTGNVRVNQLGIGTNPNAKDPLCKTVADKFLGMVHICFEPDEKLEHYYLPLSRMKIDEKEFTHQDLFVV